MSRRKDIPCVKGKDKKDKPWPDGYRLWVRPKYRLETPKICLLLPETQGAMLAKLMTRFGRCVSLGEFYDTFHATEANGGPLSFVRSVAVRMGYLRDRMWQYGVKADIQFDHFRDGYVLHSLAECTPQPGKFRERMAPSVSGRYRGVEREGGSSALMRYTDGRTRSDAAITAPRKYGYVHEVNAPPETRFCEEVPWAWPARHEKNEQLFLEQISQLAQKRKAL